MKLKILTTNDILLFATEKHVGIALFYKVGELLKQ